MKFKDKNIKEKIINILLNIFIALFSIALIISIYNTIQIKIFKNKYSNFFGYSMFEVQTNSMSDYINGNDWIIVKITNKINLKDVVTYEENGEFITHRVIEKYKGTYITKGDANNTKDEPIDQAQIVGKVVKILPNFGILRKTLFNKEVLFVLILTLLVINMMYKKKKTNVHEIIGDINNDDEVNNNTIKNNDVCINKTEDPLLDKIENDINNIKEEHSKMDINDFINKRMEEEIKKDTVIKEKEDTMDTSFLESTSNKNTETIKEDNIILNDEQNNDNNDSILSIDVDLLENEKLETQENQEVIAENEALLEAKKEEKERLEQLKLEKKELKEEERRALLEPEQLVSITLEKLQEKRKGKKSKNVIEKIMYVKSEQLNEFIDLINQNNKLEVNEHTIRNELIKAYIDAKFYNEGENPDDDDKAGLTRIKTYINDVGDTLSSEYKGQDNKYKDKVEKYKSIFELIVNLECTNYEGMEQTERNRYCKRMITEYFSNKNYDITIIEDIQSKFRDIQKKYIGVIEILMKKLETKIFTLKFNQLKSNKRMYGLSLEHNIQFDKVYSDVIIDKTYSEGIIAEDKMVVLINLLLIQLIKDMILTNFNKKYILNLPKTIYTKKNKFDNILKMVDDKYAKENVIFLTNYNNLVKNKEIIKKCKSDGYKFALIFNADLENKSGFKNNVYLVDYIFIDKDNIKETNYNELIPNDIKENIIYEDMTNKIGDLEEEGEK